ncbi:hypothetical protein JAAARDRAFT_210041 [Jaapia argillacea MUCL 33604]|uniref:F-box domain-containing protein n=1 Tax=Jaapia argillacea MUCL 33604 TaxID=933084 RepID=A0A067PEM3_9AGAM|nr:hypothetical protein JAAARDRAFT_210041 [Jaapia argillacea MUCL 33604]
MNSCSFPIFDMPTELVDRVIDYVDECPDVLSLALTCRHLKAILIPDHLRYRKLLISLERLDILETVITRPSLGRNIRILRVVPRIGLYRRFPLDRFCCRTKEAEIAAESRLALALSLMPNLTKFMWDMYHEPETKNMIWENIAATCHRFSDLRCYLLPTFRNHCENTLYHSKIFNLRHLVKIDLYIATPVWGNSPVQVDHIGRFLLGCPDLVVLTLAFGHSTPLDTVFHQASWACLESLRLEKVACHPTIFDSFLSLHTTIQNLHLTHSVNESLNQDPFDISLSPGSLPNLHTLTIYCGGPHPRIDEFLRYASWRKLRSLELSRMSCLSDVFAKFLSRHHSIEELCVDTCIAVDSPLSLLKDLLPGDLPNLRDFSGPDLDYIIVCMAGAPLQQLYLNSVEIESDMAEEALRRVAPTLCDIEFVGTPREEVVERLKRSIPELKASWAY